MPMDSSRSALCIRPALASVLDEVARVWRISAESTDGAPNVSIDESQLRSRIDVELADQWQLFVACEGRRIVGILAIRPQHAILDQLFVAPAEQGKGIGTALLGLAKAEMPIGFSLRVATSNLRARHFYESKGLRLTGEGRHPRADYPVCFYAYER